MRVDQNAGNKDACDGQDPSPAWQGPSAEGIESQDGVGQKHQEMNDFVGRNVPQPELRRIPRGEFPEAQHKDDGQVDDHQDAHTGGQAFHKACIS